ncbi:hypothetical protein KAFR_0J00150 [Kazachstania africana CBS 2517]|uniref:Brl1/Brr6 domain-containing protein n=1 Tax=Kazachstania africana (strain ATCC 22294 / BCRC 22015 / CBS 2517 / CECT 1963 / NBRC 1671 / NRRL Y-8276) TaxID=1071382 RepID=H2B0D3_KAZAF|nr:hypothetical protein KAFR_0J00150 [Kazachstania africana CBS 2517]CCF60083.1 hypothetical protein KAFR_0J00150 [Kazachstania africana CBS 2517]
MDNGSRLISRYDDRLLKEQDKGLEQQPVLKLSHKNDSIWYNPKLIAEYVQLLFNTIITSFLLYLVIRFLIMINNDVHFRLEELKQVELSRISNCKSDYYNNECHMGEEIPALTNLCSKWYQCMNIDIETHRDLSESAKLWARILAEVINAFVSEISMRSLFFLLFTICSLVIVTNVAFGTYRVFHYNNTR